MPLSLLLEETPADIADLEAVLMDGWPGEFSGILFLSCQLTYLLQGWEGWFGSPEH